ncbi:hypothetical protein [Pseudomonas sp. PB3P13]
MNTYQNACDRGAMPLSATFEPVPASETDGVAVTGLGIVTVTYR